MLRRLVRLGSFPACWRLANVTTIPKRPPSSSVENYLTISITSVLFKAFERLVSVRRGRFMECSSVHLTTQFAYRKGLGTYDALLYMSHTLQSALESGQKARIVQIDFSKISSVLSILIQFPSNRSQHVWWMVIGVNWLTIYQESRTAVFWSRCCSFCILRSFFPS